MQSWLTIFKRTDLIDYLRFVVLIYTVELDLCQLKVFPNILVQVLSACAIQIIIKKVVMLFIKEGGVRMGHAFFAIIVSKRDYWSHRYYSLEILKLNGSCIRG